MPFQRGHKLSHGRHFGSKNKSTLEKEDRRKKFDEMITQKWEEIINELKPEYVADQFMGKAPELIDAKVEYRPFDELPENNSIRKDKESEQKNQSDSRGDGSRKNSSDIDVSRNKSVA